MMNLAICSRGILLLTRAWRIRRIRCGFSSIPSRHPTSELRVDVSPAQGAVLAIGQLLGHPWIGVLLSTAAMWYGDDLDVAGWMLPEWALLAACWSNEVRTFQLLDEQLLGGAVAAIGGGTGPWSAAANSRISAAA